MEKKLVAWPIDNKHILEDFTDELHGGRFVECTNKGIVRQAFYEGAVLWEVCYEFGKNRFELHCHSSLCQEYMEAMKTKVLALADEESGLYVECLEEMRWRELWCQFLKAVEE